MFTRLFKQSIGFRCIASQCTDSCCTGWEIPLDQTTYESLSKDPYFKTTMTEYASINDNTSIKGINYAVMCCTADDRCPFLDEHNLCTLQKREGEKGLSNVCALYPRYYNRVDGVYEESLSLACIEATEILLFGEPLEIVEIDKEPQRDVIMRTIHTQAKDTDGEDMGSLFEFREAIFKLIRSVSHTFDEKLGILMTFHEYIETLVDDQLTTAIKTYDFTCKKPIPRLSENQYNKIIEILKGVGKSGHDDLDKLISGCINNSRFDQLELDKLSSLDQILSNYLIHQMFKDLYPFITGHKKMGSFQFLLKKVHILRLLLAYNGLFDNKSVAHIIQMYSKGLEHHAAFLYELEDMTL